MSKAQEEETTEKMIRMPEGLREILRRKKEEDEDARSFSDVLKRDLPVDTESNQLQIPENDMVLVTVDDETHERIHSLAGENISAYEVILHYVAQSDKYVLSKEDNNGDTK